jgi:hypothetical protein
MRKLNTSDCFKLLRLINETGIKETLGEELKDLVNGKKTVLTEEEGGMEFIFALISAFGTKGAEQAFYEFLAGPLEMSEAEIASLPPTETLAKIKELASLDEWKDFFGSAAKLGG